MLTNPTPVIYQNLKTAMDSTPKEKEKPKMGLLGPKNKDEMRDVDVTAPVNRIASYVEAIKAKREEIKNG